MEVRFHCLAALRKRAAKSAHRVLDECPRVQAVLRANPAYGVVVPGHAPLRKLRVRVPSLQCGKSGGYRAIYQTATIDQAIYVVLLSTYYKGDAEDLDADTYRALQHEARSILAHVSDHAWSD